MDKKTQVVDALRAFINQRPGLEFGNYGSVAGYRAELRQITRDRREALELLRAVEWRDSITAEDLIAASKGAYSGRLTIEQRADGAVSVGYCTGQYFPTEYRKAACAVLASALWDHTREHCAPTPANPASYRRWTASKGDWLRRYFAQEFGRGIASRWFR